MPKKWTELTVAEIDTLEGEPLSWAVGEAMGYEMRQSLTYCRVLRCQPDKMHGSMCSAWEPHTDANQALEVWAAMWRVEPTMVVMCGDAVIELDGVELADADFCTAICRAFLKVRQADEAND